MARRRRRRGRIDRVSKEIRERKYRLRARTSRFIPDADSDFAHMARCFASHIARNAERLPLPAGQVAELSGAVEAFREALARTMVHATAGPRATILKNEAREKAEQTVRAAARVLRADDSLTRVDRATLNLPERPKRLRRRQCPQIAPVLRFRGTTQPDWPGHYGWRHVLEYVNDFDHGSSARPHGAARLELFVELVPVDEPIPTHPGQRSGGRLWYLRSFSTRRFEVEFPVLADGTPMLVVYWGRWADARGNVGPFSKTCVARVEGRVPGTMPVLPGNAETVRVEVVPPAQLPGAVISPSELAGVGMLLLPGQTQAGCTLLEAA